MTSSRRSLRFLALLVVLLLIVTACVRPFSQSDEEAAQATAEAEVTAQADEEGQTAEPVDEDSDSENADSADTDEAVDEQEEEASTEAEEQGEADEHVEADSDSDADLEETEEDSDEDAAESEESSSETADEDVDSTEADSNEDAAAEDAATDQDSSMDADAEAAPESDAGETATTTEPTPLPAVHVVSKGENLFRIGLRYGLSWVPLAYYNNIPNPDLIYVGQNIYIPGGQAPPTQSKPESSMYTNYVVKRGDTLFRISLASGVSPEEIVEANGIVNPNRIYAGQVLKIPTGTP